jgi:hypothetical protein
MVRGFMKKLLIIIFLGAYGSVQAYKIAKPIKNQKKGQEAFIDDIDIPMLALKITNKSEVDQMYSYYNKNGQEIVGVLPPTNTVFIDLATVDLSKGPLFGITRADYKVANNKKNLDIAFLGTNYSITAEATERIQVDIIINDTGSTINFKKSVPVLK